MIAPDRQRWHPLPTTALVAALALVVACEEQIDPEFIQCELEVALSATEGAAQTVVVATGGPFSTVYDTSVRFGGTQAPTLDVTRDQCDDCDGCKLSVPPFCDSCEACPHCRSECAPCVQTVTFQVPDVALGPTSVVLTNGYGASPPVPFTVLAPDTGDTGDSGR